MVKVRPRVVMSAPDDPEPAFPAPCGQVAAFSVGGDDRGLGHGGALLFEGIRSMFWQPCRWHFGGVAQQPAITETVINNYYGDDAMAADDDLRHGGC